MVLFKYPVFVVKVQALQQDMQNIGHFVTPVEIEVDNFGRDWARPPGIPGLLEGQFRNLQCFMVAFSLFIGTWNWFEGADIVHLV